MTSILIWGLALFKIGGCDLAERCLVRLMLFVCRWKGELKTLCAEVGPYILAGSGRMQPMWEVAVMGGAKLLSLMLLQGSMSCLTKRRPRFGASSSSCSQTSSTISATRTSTPYAIDCAWARVDKCLRACLRVLILLIIDYLCNPRRDVSLRQLPRVCVWAS